LSRIGFSCDAKTVLFFVGLVGAMQRCCRKLSYIQLISTWCRAFVMHRRPT